MDESDIEIRFYSLEPSRHLHRMAMGAMSGRMPREGGAGFTGVPIMAVVHRALVGAVVQVSAQGAVVHERASAHGDGCT